MIYSAGQIAERCGVKERNVRALAQKYHRGRRLGARSLMFSERDLEWFLFHRPRPGRQANTGAGPKGDER